MALPRPWCRACRSSVSKTTIPWEVTSGDGTTVQYVSVIDDREAIFDISDDTTELLGTSRLPGGPSQQFEVMAAGGLTELTSQQSDGSVFTLRVPLTAPDFMMPDFSQPTTGTYALGEVVIEFTLSSTAQAPNRWARMTSSAAGGISGEFSLAADFAGTGRVLQDGRLVALPTWQPDGDADINWVSAESSRTAPAGAVLDYLAHRWQTLAALLAPPSG